MKFAIRTDASLQIGTGHVMRCLTLAESLRRSGAMVTFISRELPGHMIDRIEGCGFPVCRLTSATNLIPMDPPPHAAWASVGWEQDAEETRIKLEECSPDCLVVDHYAFDERWESAVQMDAMQVLVLDDLADRPHDCDLLLDQNLGRKADDYRAMVPDHCKLLIGPSYALLRPEFAAQRSKSLARRTNPRAEHILISLGGIDRDNVTATVLLALQDVGLPDYCRVSVVLGHNSPWFDDVRTLAPELNFRTEVLRGVEDVATLMAESDLAIGAAGSTSWERCCLGLPSFILVLAENQYPAAQALVREGAAKLLHANRSQTEQLRRAFSDTQFSQHLKLMSLQAAKITDGLGVSRVINHLEAIN